MRFSILSYLLKVLLFLYVSPPFNFIQTSIDSIPLHFHTPNISYTLDYGRIIQKSPSLVLKPKTPQDISLLLQSISSIDNNLTVAARGAGHSTHGQAHAPDGIIVDMTELPRAITVGKTKVGCDGNDHFFVDADGGALWIEILEETLKHGLTPPSWTDYLYLTVGGTLSVGGIGGQTFKYGPQIANVFEMDVVTGRGELMTCSEVKNPDLFYAVLGGLGQFGIITRARIALEVAPKMVKWIKLFYDDFNRFTRDQEHLMSMEKVDYVEGFIKLNEDSHSSSHVTSRLSLDVENHSKRMVENYAIEIAIYYNEDEAIHQKLDEILSRLSFIPPEILNVDISYLDFLNRVRLEEQKLHNQGLWEVPHPWLDLFVPRSHINQFKDLLLQTISTTPIGGPLIIYPVLKHKWNQKMSIILPQDQVGEDIFYVVNLLRSVAPSCRTYGSSCLQIFLAQNQEIIEISTSKASICRRNTEVDIITDTIDGTLGTMMAIDGVMGATMMDIYGGFCMRKMEGREVEMMDGGDGMGVKQYMPYLMDESGWRGHFGEEWERFEELKSKFDPLHVLSPGQRIFKRKIKGGCIL
ncbi:cytokinin dehydrogenase 6-like [Magnolia sinica]|uniref:cytokinin dehydrogenase 6-like n=1 Tax=Magnolia sinica TaxID=86752 RepID=UPI00265AF1B6|nr:cytokinin dehydrogenase 6-like [Magnolia sinica]